MDAFYTGLLANFGILAMCGLLLASIAPIWRNQRNGLIRYQLIAGMVFGLTTAALILFSTSFVGGTVFDSRAAPAILSGVIGGPWLKPKMQRTGALSSSSQPPGESSSVPTPRRASRRAACRRAAAGVSDGIRPSGGSTISDVRSVVTVLPQSNQKSL